MEGWIKIYRKLINWEWFGDSNVVHIFVYLLLVVNFEDKKWQGIDILKGQVITSILSISKATKLSHQQVRTALSKLEKSGEITKESNRIFTRITINNFESYQGEGDCEEVIDSSREVIEKAEEVEYYPTEEVVVEKETSEAVLFPEEVKEKKEKSTLFKNSIFTDAELLASKLDPIEFKDIDFNYYYNAVYDWSEQKNVKRTNNGWVATLRMWMRKDIASGRPKKVKTSGYGIENQDLKEFMKY